MILMALDDKHLVVSILSSYFVLTAVDELEGIFFSLGFISLKTSVVIPVHSTIDSTAQSIPFFFFFSPVCAVLQQLNSSTRTLQ